MSRTSAGDHFAATFLKSRLLRFVISGDWAEPDRSKSAGTELTSSKSTWFQNHSLDRNAEKQVTALAQQAARSLELNPKADMSIQMRKIDQSFWTVWKDIGEGLGPEMVRYMFLSQIRKEIKDIMYGLGPLEDLLENPTISEIMVNDADNIFIEKNGIVENSGRRFVKDLEDFIRRIVSRVQRKIDTSEPMVDIRMLVKNALHMLQAMNTGHDGSMTTLHANTPDDVISRLEVMVQQSADSNLPVSSIHQQIASALDLVIQLSTEIVPDPKRSGERMHRRFVSAITEVVGIDPEARVRCWRTPYSAAHGLPADHYRRSGDGRRTEPQHAAGSGC